MMTGLPLHRRVTALRRALVAVIVVSFGLAAVLGIVVLLGAELGVLAGRVLGTTSVVGSFSIAVLCCAALLGRRGQSVGLAGVVVSVLTAALVVWVIWDEALRSAAWDPVFRVMWTGVAASAAFALASLLLLLGDRRRGTVRIGLATTLALIAILLGLTIWAIWARSIEWQIFQRVYGIVAILTALGAVVVPVLSLLLPDGRPGGGLSRELAARLAAEASRRGMTVEELVAPVLADATVAAPPEPVP
ncbi:hypothetical protein [Microbacterium ulmi]|uniref:Uncharacterized protein n=1 Tax=Microbacterium ulmi TaxID=179095 RepID=A0A7Y2Q2A7_9MICO|nr:hypothetical protein [Microbacterium ulmi]NII70550.1 MFS family permease [Microbacterium ulmi]NNH05232.1 hypothetical protein [Microbacterium ulmi]